MRILITLLWRILARLLRRVGWGGLLVPVAAIGMAVLGVTVWTAAAIVLAAVLAVRRPSAAAGLLPVTLICAGLWGLVLAADTPGGMAWTAMPAWSVQVVSPKYVVSLVPATPPARKLPLAVPAGKAAASHAVPRQTPAKGATVTWLVPPPPKPAYRFAVAQRAGGPGLRATGPGVIPGAVTAPAMRKLPGGWIVLGPGPRPLRVPAVVVTKVRPQPPARFLPNWLLVPLALRAPPRSASTTPTACCGYRCPTTGPAARTRHRAPGWPAWSGGLALSMASWP